MKKRGRKAKIGFDYFPFDVDFFQDIKIRKLIRQQGGKAVPVYALLLCFIYKNGYYIGGDKELAFIISEQLGYEEAYIQEVIKSCLSLGLFDEELYKKENVLTSEAIQRRFKLMCFKSNRIYQIDEYSLLIAQIGDNDADEENIEINNEENRISYEENIISYEEIPISYQENAISSQKMQQSKVKKSKLNYKEKNLTEKKEVEVELSKKINNEEILQKMLREQISVESFCLNNRITQDEFETYARAVFADWQLTGETHTNEIEMRKHLLNTVRIKIKTNLKSKDNEDRLKRRRGVEPPDISREEFDGSW